MLSEKALDLIKELQRSKTLPAYNEELIRQVLEEMKVLFELNHNDVEGAVGGRLVLYNSMQMRHSSLERNKRCLLAYIHRRMMMMKKMRWEVGSVLSQQVNNNLSTHELRWFEEYNRSLVSYMRTQHHLDLTLHLKPPKSLYIEVRCVVEHGEFETQDGNTITLSKNSQHFLMASECEHLIRNGTLEHILQ